MKVYNHPSEFTRDGFNVVTIGTFDGVHLGHQKILSRLKALAEKHGGETVLITFWPHPRHLLYPEQHLPLINTIDEKIDLLSGYGVDHLIQIPFTKEFSQTTSQEFIKDILVEQVSTDLLVVGYNHRFGKNREGSFEHLKKQEGAFGFATEEISREELDEISISSTNIRKALEQGDIVSANSFLGHRYALTGKVTEGDRIGRKIGYPTANLTFPSVHKLVPPDGVYAVQVHVEGKIYGGMLYIGTRPTIDGTHKVVEVNLFDFEKDIYNLKIQVDLVRQIRGDLKFENLDELADQLKQDKIDSLSILANEAG